MLNLDHQSSHYFKPRKEENNTPPSICVLTSHLFWWQFWLSGKVFQGVIIGPHHHIFGAYVMASSFETMYHNPHFLFMCWPPSLRLAQLLAFKCHWPSILHSLDCKVKGIGVDLNNNQSFVTTLGRDKVFKI